MCETRWLLVGKARVSFLFSSHFINPFHPVVGDGSGETRGKKAKQRALTRQAIMRPPQTAHKSVKHKAVNRTTAKGQALGFSHKQRDIRRGIWMVPRRSSVWGGRGGGGRGKGIGWFGSLFPLRPWVRSVSDPTAILQLRGSGSDFPRCSLFTTFTETS